MKSGITEDAHLAFLQHSQGTISTMTMAVNDHCFGSTTDTEHLAALRREPKSNYHDPAESTIDSLLTNYRLVSMQAVTQYADSVGLMENDCLLLVRY